MRRPSTLSKVLIPAIAAVVFVALHGYIYGIYSHDFRDWNKYLKVSQISIATSRSPYDRFLAVTHAQIPAFECKDYILAKEYASEALLLAAQFKQDWNYGNAIHYGHVVLGRLALVRGDVESAGQELLLAGKTPGSPTLDSFGPNMSLAKELLEHGQREVVYQYFNECRVFWKSDFGALTKWRFLAHLHLPPDFGTNLVY